MESINCVFDCDDVCPEYEEGLHNISLLADTFPEMSISLYVPINWHFKHPISLDYKKYLEHEINHPIEMCFHGMIHNNPAQMGECEFLCKTSHFEDILSMTKGYGFTKVARPPGWAMTNDNLAILNREGWVHAGHPGGYKNLSFININENPTTEELKRLHKNVIIHSHADWKCGANNIENLNNLDKTIHLINELKKIYKINWTTSKEIYKNVETH